MGKQPSFQFYPGDWKRDAGVQSLSFEERGVWFEMMLLMFESAERGKLVFGSGTPIPEDAVARSLGLDRQRYVQILRKLLDYGVASKEEETGIIYCRRMVKDAELSRKRAECGKLGGNPNLLNQNSSKREAKSNQNGKQNPTPSSSSSISFSLEKEKIYKKEKEARGATSGDSYTLADVMEAARDPRVGVGEDEANAFFDYYDAQGWEFNNGRGVANLHSALRRWKRGKRDGPARVQGATSLAPQGRQNRNAGTYNDPNYKRNEDDPF